VSSNLAGDANDFNKLFAHSDHAAPDGRIRAVGKAARKERCGPD
jgi:hypothetical protein